MPGLSHNGIAVGQAIPAAAGTSQLVYYIAPDLRIALVGKRHNKPMLGTTAIFIYMKNNPAAKSFAGVMYKSAAARWAGGALWSGGSLRPGDSSGTLRASCSGIAIISLCSGRALRSCCPGWSLRSCWSCGSRLSGWALWSSGACCTSGSG